MLLSSHCFTSICDDKQRISKFLVRLQPQTICMPDITSKVTLVCSTVIKAASPNIVCTSQSLLVTVHSDDLIRVWTTDDGRCVLCSHKSMLPSKPVGIVALSEYPGYAAVACANSEVLIVDLYTMHAHSTISLPEMSGFTSIEWDFELGQLRVTDLNGRKVTLEDKIHNRNRSLAMKAEATWD